MIKVHEMVLDLRKEMVVFHIHKNNCIRMLEGGCRTICMKYNIFLCSLQIFAVHIIAKVNRENDEDDVRTVQIRFSKPGRIHRLLRDFFCDSAIR